MQLKLLSCSQRWMVNWNSYWNNFLNHSFYWLHFLCIIIFDLFVTMSFAQSLYYWLKYLQVAITITDLIRTIDTFDVSELLNGDFWVHIFNFAIATGTDSHLYWDYFQDLKCIFDHLWLCFIKVTASQLRR